MNTFKEFITSRKFWSIVAAFAMYAQVNPAVYKLFGEGAEPFIFHTLQFIVYLGLIGLGFASNSTKDERETLRGLAELEGAVKSVGKKL